MISPSDSEAGGEMKYAILGEDNAEDSEKLEKFLGEVTWEYLKPHYERDCLLFVDEGLELTVVGEAMASDDSEQVKKWFKSGELVKIEAIHAFQWEGGKTLFQALVISPFVLFRPV